MHPYFFGPLERQLFGMLHPAQVAAARGHGVVLCYPWGQEYVNSLRGCRQLSTRMARAGFDVLRFDYFGCGDSAGVGEEADLSVWMRDVDTAIEEIKSRRRVSTISLVGVRLGGSLASLVAADRDDVVGLVLWEPVVKGRNYLAQLRTRHAGFLRSEAEGGRSQDAHSTANEIMGFPLPPAMVRDLEQLDLLTVERAPAPEILLLENGGQAPQGALAAHLTGLCKVLDRCKLPAQNIWVREVGQERVLVPTDTLQAIIEWLTARA